MLDSAFWRWRLANPLADYRVVHHREHPGTIAVLAVNRPNRHLDAVHVVELTGDPAAQRELLHELDRRPPTSLTAWPRHEADAALLSEAGFVIDRPTGRLTADARRPTVLLQPLHSTTAGWGTGASDDPVAGWSPSPLAFDEH